jgi:hypothetical protein
MISIVTYFKVDSSDEPRTVSLPSNPNVETEPVSKSSKFLEF